MGRRQLDGLQYVCVDEKAVGQGHDYVTIVTGVIAGKGHETFQEFDSRVIPFDNLEMARELLA